MKGTRCASRIGPLIELTPRLPRGHPIDACSDMIRMSQESAMPVPPASAMPLIATITGLEVLRIVR